MTPISLEFTAFGPYLDRQRIDFDRLSGARFFLIHGETGAGKTVILDAMTYALYGKSSGGARGDMTSMRCGTAPPSAKTEVAFTFGLRGETYRFVRSLRAVAKRSGATEYTPEQTALIRTPDGIYAPLFENPTIARVEAKAAELIGLSYEQFRQVILLPQGQFERLLTSKSDEKEAILVSLFGARRWNLAADRLHASLSEELRTLDTEKALVRRALEEYGAGSADGLERILEEREQEEKQLQRALEALSARARDAAKRLEDARAVYQIFVQLEAARDEELRLAQSGAGHEAHERALQRLARYGLLTALYDKLERAGVQLRGALKIRDEAGRQLDRAEKAQAALLDDKLREETRQARLYGEYAALHRRYISGAAASLAGELSPGEPCPVCGSTHHPAPASGESGAVTREELQRKDAEIESARLTLGDISAKLRETQERRAPLAREYEAASLMALTAQSDYDSYLSQADPQLPDARALGAAMATAREEAAKIEAHGVALAAARQNIGRLAEQLGEAEKPDVHALEAEASALDAERGELASRLALARDRMQRLRAVSVSVRGKEAALAQKEGQCRDNLAFAQSVRGDRGISLERYVLGVMLSSVTAEANKLLDGVLGGRYRLFRTVEATGRARKAGLELEVFDSATGGARGVATLSGGEKFLVSLALSIGLSTVVQTQAGGVRFGAMFIDEGFGSLDAASVGDALAVLAHMSRSNALVGIISHVPALKESIDAKIEVVKGPAGSTLSFQV